MRRHGVVFGFILALVSGTFFAALHANGLKTTPGTPVHMVVTVESRHDAKLPEITREDVVVTEGHDRDKVTEWTPAIGEHSGLDLYVLVDDSSSYDVDAQLSELRAFIMQQPPSTFIAVGYMHNGSVETVQDLTEDHTDAAKAVRLPFGRSAGAASPYFSVEDLVKRWQPNPARPRREIIMITSGIDLYSPGSVDPYLDEAIQQAQRAGIIIYSIYASGGDHFGRSSWRLNWGQNNLSRVSDEVGGEPYGLGIMTVPSFKPYFDDISRRLSRQYLLTFLARPDTKAEMRSIKLSTEVPNAELVGAPRVYVPASPSPSIRDEKSVN
jgi:hypothetical protein